MQRRVKNRVGLTAVTVVLAMFAFPVTAHATSGLVGPGVAYFGTDSGSSSYGSFVCDDRGHTSGGELDYTAQDDAGWYSLEMVVDQLASANGVLLGGEVVLCGEMSRQPSDDAALGAVGAACASGYSAPPAPSGRNGQGRMTFYLPDRGYYQFRDVRWAQTPASGIVVTGEYTSSPGMPNASTGTAVIYVQMSPLWNDCLTLGGAMSYAPIIGGSFALIPDVA